MFVSSHLLTEVEQTCDRVAIIDRGRLVLSGRVDDVLAEAARPRCSSAWTTSSPVPTCLRRRRSDVEPDRRRCCGWRCAATEAAHVTKLLADAGLYVSELRPDAVTLEELFLEHHRTHATRRCMA